MQSPNDSEAKVENPSMASNDESRSRPASPSGTNGHAPDDEGALEKSPSQPGLTPGQLEAGNNNGNEEKVDEKEEKEEAQDPHLVTWEGPNDPMDPKAWSFKRRWLITGLVSLITFMTPIASSMVAPAEDAIDKSLNVHSTITTELIFAIFLAAFIVGPFFLAPLCEVYGRVIVLQLANIWFLIFNLVCGFAQNSGEMLAFRFLAGLGGCAPQTIGGGVLGDLWTSEERGMAVAIYTLAPVLGPALGPLLGAWITERTTWRWSFWAVTIFGVAVQILLYFTLAETFAPRILQLKAAKLRKETGNSAFHTQWETEDRRVISILRKSSWRVFILLGTQPIIQFLAIYMALVYGIIYLILATFPQVWTTIYGESVGIGGLNYISLMLGLTAGAQTAGRAIDRIYKRLKTRAPNGEGRPEFRVPILFVSTALVASGLLIFGWTAEYHVQWIVPNIGAFIFAMGTSMTFTGLQTYTIDSYPLYAASAVGAIAAARTMTGFGFPLFADYMYDALGQGWGNTVLALCTLGIGYCGSIILWVYGERLRKASQYANDK